MRVVIGSAPDRESDESKPIYRMGLIAKIEKGNRAYKMTHYKGQTEVRLSVAIGKQVKSNVKMTLVSNSRATAHEFAHYRAEIEKARGYKMLTKKVRTLSLSPSLSLSFSYPLYLSMSFSLSFSVFLYFSVSLSVSLSLSVFLCFIVPLSQCLSISFFSLSVSVPLSLSPSLSPSIHLCSSLSLSLFSLILLCMIFPYKLLSSSTTCQIDFCCASFLPLFFHPCLFSLCLLYFYLNFISLPLQVRTSCLYILPEFFPFSPFLRIPV